MIVGIMSDTHGNVARTATAALLLKMHGVETVFHCGDLGSEQVLIELAGAFGDAGIPVHAVLGNVDLWSPEIAEFPPHTGVQVHGSRYEAEVDGERLAVLHGHESRRLEAAVTSGDYDYVLTGHTHRREVRREGPTRVINPGAVHRTLEPSIAVLNTKTDDLRFIESRQNDAQSPSVAFHFQRSHRILLPSIEDQTIEIRSMPTRHEGTLFRFPFESATLHANSISCNVFLNRWI